MEKKTTAIIIDDMPKYRNSLRKLLEAHPDIEVVQECASGAEGLVAIARHVPQLVFLDVEMPGMTGLEMLAEIKVRNFEVIFITAFDRFAVQAFRMASIDYIVKPVQAPVLAEALQRFRDGVDKQYRAAQYDILARHVQTKPGPESPLAITTNKRNDEGNDEKGTITEFVTVREIAYCTSDKSNLWFHLLDGTMVRSGKGINHYEEVLRPYGIVRIERSTLVNRAHLTVYRISENSVTVRLDKGTVTLTVGPKYKASFDAGFVS